jgi:hypothetical protein
MPDQNQNQDPWAVVSTTPAPPASPQTVGDVAGPATHVYDPTTKSIQPIQSTQNDPWAVISQTPAQPAPAKTGVVAGVKRNTVDSLTGLWHAFNQPATDEEKQAILAKVREANQRGDKIPEEIATNPSKGTLALHRLIDAPADELLKKGRDEVGVAQDLIANHKYWKGGNLYLSGLTDKVLSGIPLVGPVIGSIAQRGEGSLVPAVDKTGKDIPVADVPAERKDFSGAATDVGAALALEHAPAIVKGTGKAVGKAAEAVADTAKAAPGKIISGAQNTAEAIKPEWLTKRAETAPAQHGTPSRVEAPLDGPTVGKQLGGKDLSAEALETLQQHVGETIPAGSNAKNMLTKAVEPVVKTINETASKMNKTVADAHPFTTSVLQDNVFGEGSLTNQIDEIKKNLPPSVKEGLSADVDAVMQDADEALNSTDPASVLEARRKLGNKIDWDDIVKNPTTAAEVQNAARAKVYRALGEKIHSEIPETVELDKTLQPNLELRSHMVRKLGERVVDDPIAATAEHQSEFKKGKTTVENAVHNEEVQKNWSKVKYALIGAGVGTGLIHEIESFLK